MLLARCWLDLGGGIAFLSLHVEPACSYPCHPQYRPQCRASLDVSLHSPCRGEAARMPL